MRPTLLLLASAVALVFGIGVVGAWTALVGLGAWVVPAVLVWTAMVLGGVVAVWQRQR